MNDPWDFIKSLGVKHFEWNDPFFTEGNKKCHFLEKVPCVDLDDESVLHEYYGQIICNVPRCKKSFNSVAEHAAHQRSCHTNVCATCRNSFPTHHLLDLHIAEVHDSFFFVMAQKKPMYRCLLETCTESFRDPQERKTHCMTEHMFPSDFRYDLSWRKIDKVPLKKHGKQMEQDFSQGMECDETEIPDSNLQSKESLDGYASPFLKKPKDIPSSVSFGAGIPRGFQRCSRGRGNKSRGKGFHSQGSSTKHKMKGDGNIDMKDVEKALMQETEMKSPT